MENIRRHSALIIYENLSDTVNIDIIFFIYVY